MKLEVLISCMHKSEFSIIEDSNLNDVNTLIVNQCGNEEIIELDKKHKVINTTTRGLSISRNIALANTIGDICLICDDDEQFVDNLEYLIIKAYNFLPEADIIIFNMANWGKTFGNTPRMLSKLELMRVSSVRISFKRNSVQGKIFFDSLLGAGTSCGSGEDNKFLLDCYKKKLKIYYMPYKIGSVSQEQSTWFSGYDRDYFYKKGMVTRYIYGFLFSVLYGFYFVVTKKNIYQKDIDTINAFVFFMKGIVDDNVSK